MHNFTPEHILLYLLDELAPHLRPELEQALRDRPDLQAELHSLYDGLAQLTPMRLEPAEGILNRILQNENIPISGDVSM